MSSETATANLRQEHQRILEVVGVLERILDAAPGSPGPGDRDAGVPAAEGSTAGALDLEALGGCMEFFRLFTDACHHGKEEDVLFPELVEQGMPKEQGPIAVMLLEHQLGRGLVGRMTAALAGLEEGDISQRDQLEAAGRDYIVLIRSHILKEDHVLFEMADGLLEGPACQRVCGQLHEICSRRFDGKTHADLEALASRLLEAYPEDGSGVSRG